MMSFALSSVVKKNCQIKRLDLKYFCRFALSECRIMVIMSASQAEDGGPIPLTRSLFSLYRVFNFFLFFPFFVN